MVGLKTQITIRYSPLLNMSSLGRGLGAKYLEFGEARIENPGHGHERIVLWYEDRGYTISYDWVNLVFTIERGGEDLSKPTGPTRDYFDLLGRLRSLEEFGRIRKAEVDSWYIAEPSDGAPKTPEEFRHAYLREGVLGAALGGEDLDLSVVVETRKSNRVRSVKFGPYAGESDFKKHNLIVFPIRERADVYSLRGCLFGVTISSEATDFGFEEFVYFYNESQTMVKACLQR